MALAVRLAEADDDVNDEDVENDDNDDVVENREEIDFDSFKLEKARVELNTVWLHMLSPFYITVKYR